MAVSRAMRRLLQIRDLEEEQARLALESGLVELRRLEHALAAAADRDRGGWRLVAESVRTAELTDRLAGLEETRAAHRLAGLLAPRIADAGQDVTQLREQYLASRVERRQAETLIQEAEARDALDGDRRSQQAIDDWFRNRMHRAGEQAGTPAPDKSPDATDRAAGADQSAEAEET